ncbi:YfcC family protein, partial [Lactobacillus mulieris]|nr:YfcC family protein [Lactobacillus mulieris]
VEILTNFIPSGNYATLAYKSDSNNFVITEPNGSTKKESATQKTLDNYKVNIEISKFKDGTIYKPVAIPNSYERIKSKKPNLLQAV